MKLKSLILTICLSLFALSGVLAQDKYEYATVSAASLNGKVGQIYVNKAQGYTEIDFKIDGNISSATVLIDYVEKMQTEGWEVFTVLPYGLNNYHSIYHLRKKKNQ